MAAGNARGVYCTKSNDTWYLCPRLHNRDVIKKKGWVYKVKQKAEGFVEGEIGCKGVSIKRWFRW